MAADATSREVKVAATDRQSDSVTIRETLHAVDAWRVEDVHFAFDSSAILPSMATDLARLGTMLQRLPDHPLSVFGHADTVGTDGYNKPLSGRRALAVYGLLTRNVSVWRHLAQNRFGGDDWTGRRLVQEVFVSHLAASGQAPPPGAPPSQIFRAYMDLLARDQAGAPFEVGKTAFLGKGADSDFKADVQGCSEFNPVVMFSAEEEHRFASASDKTERNAEGAANRRVVVFFFPPGTAPKLSAWPCPRATEGITGCLKRFWSDAPKRRRFQERRREFPIDRDTFACRFYDRLGDESAATRPFVFRVQLHDESYQPCRDVDCAVTLSNGVTRTVRTDADGFAFITADRDSQEVTVAYTPPESETRLVLTVQVPGPDLDRDARLLAHLVNVGFGAPGEEPPRVISKFQAANPDLKPSGILDPATRAAIEAMISNPALRDSIEDTR